MNRGRFSIRIAGGALLVGAAMSGGCAAPNTAAGAGVGGVTGAAAGGLIGAASGHPLAGAAIGGLTGGVIGGAVGNDVDMQQKRDMQMRLASAEGRAAAAEARPVVAPLGITDVQQLAASGVSDDVIINQIVTTGSTYRLSPTDIAWLRTNGVSDRVIIAMQNSVPRPAPVPVYPQRVIYTRPVYVYPPYYAPPPPPVGFGFTFMGR